jgi:hypothetical protein
MMAGLFAGRDSLRRELIVVCVGQGADALFAPLRDLDFADADFVLQSPYRFDVPSPRGSEMRVASFAYVFDVLHVLLVPPSPPSRPPARAGNRA